MESGFFGRLVEARTLGRYHLTLREYERDLRIPPHQHRTSYLTVVVGGGYDESWDGGSRACATSDVILHAAGERHADRFGAGRTRCLDVYGSPIEHSGHLPARRAAMLGTRIYREFRQPDGFSPSVLDALILEASVEAARSQRRDLTPAWLRHVRGRIEADFTNGVALSGLAAEIDVHPAHLARSFRHHYGRTIGELVRELRVDFACRRLIDGTPPGVVALEAGFADQSHLTRSFRRLTGVTPAAFRRLHTKRVPDRN